MNWFKQGQQNYLWDNDSSLPFSTINWENSQQTINEINNIYPKSRGDISGLSIDFSSPIPNTSSISSSLNKYHILKDIREIPIDQFNTNLFYASDDINRSKALSKEILLSRKIKPLIVVIDKEGPYILEGAHRLYALSLIGVKSIPALVVINMENLYELV